REKVQSLTPAVCSHFRWTPKARVSQSRSETYCFRLKRGAKIAREQGPEMLKNLSFSVGILLMAPALAGMAQSKSVVVEEVVARVNNEVITRSDLEHAGRDRPKSRSGR